MSWITVIWSATATICLTLAGVHFAVWLKSRDSWLNLLFAISATSASACAGFELAMMHSQTLAEFGEVLRWLHVPIALMVVSLIWFVRRYLQAGRLWMVWLFCSLRAVTLALSQEGLLKLSQHNRCWNFSRNSSCLRNEKTYCT